MKGGGVMEGGMWVARVKTLRTLDHIRCTHWADVLWAGGETYVVVWAEPTGLRDGYWHVKVYPLDCPTESRTLCIPADDKVHVVARDMPADTETKVPSQKKAVKPKKGEQLKLF